jgi:hypothetical protein
MSIYEKCMQCDKPMLGIMNHAARQVCDPCGGYGRRDSVKQLEEMREAQKELELK